jgi:hypothetical protein
LLSIGIRQNFSKSFSAVYIDQQINNGKQIDLKVHSYPMLPWIGDNQGSINGINRLVEEGSGRYYIHCYLGKHRVEVIRQIILSSNNEEVPAKKWPLVSDFERGNIYTYNQNQTIIGPYPTEEE